MNYLYSFRQQWQTLTLAPSGLVYGKGGLTKHRWSSRGDILIFDDASGSVYRMRRDRAMVFGGRTSPDDPDALFLIPMEPPPCHAEQRNELELRFFGMKRSGHHPVLGWFISQLPAPSYFFNDCRPFLDPFRTHWHTLPFVEQYPCLIDHGLPGQVINRPFGYITEDGVRRVEEIRNTAKAHLVVNFEDFHPCLYREHIVSPAFVGASADVQNVIILRDPFNNLASRIVMEDDDGVEPSKYEILVSTWTAYAREVLGETSHIPKKHCIIYNRWFCDRSYRDQVAKAAGLINSDVGIDVVPPNGGGSSFDRMAYNGKGRGMSVLNRWERFRNTPAFWSMFRDEELMRCASLLFPDECKAIRDASLL